MYYVQTFGGSGVKCWTNQNRVGKKMAVFTGKVASLTSKLIQNVTGFQVSLLIQSGAVFRGITFVANFQPDEENYTLCFKFCKSNFCYHRFLDVNSTNVTRAIEK